MKRCTAAFTLLELLVAVSVTAVLAAALITTSTATLAVWQRAQGASEALSQASSVFSFIERDLQGTYVRADTDAMLAVDVIGDETEATSHGWFSGSKKPTTQLLLPAGTAPDITDARFGFGGCWLRLITTKLDSNSTGRDRSSPSAIAYLLLRKRIGTDDSISRYRLFRADVRQTSTSATPPRPGTFQAGYSLTAAAYTSASTTQADTGTVFSPATADALADNVVDFGVWLYARDTSGNLQRVFPTGAGSIQYRTTGSGTRIEVVDVMVRILTQEGGRLINAIENGRASKPAGLSNDEWWWSVALANSQVFSRRIELKAGSL